MKDQYVLDILETKEGKDIIKSASISLKTDWRNVAETFVLSSIISQLTGLTNFVGSAISKLYNIKSDKLLKSFTSEQVNFLRKNPSEFDKQLELNIIASVRLMVGAEKLDDEAEIITSFDRMAFDSIRHMSLTEGFESESKRKDKMHNKLKWKALAFPISLILHHCITNKIIDRDKAKMLISSLLKFGEESDSPLILCFSCIPDIINKEIADYDINEFKRYSTSYKTF